MTKEELRSEIKNRLRTVDETRKYPSALIDSMTARAWNTILNQVCQDPKKRKDLDLYAKRYALTVIGEVGAYYSNIAGYQIANLPDPRHGVRAVYANDDMQMEFYPYTSRTIQQFKGLDFDTVCTKTGYKVTRGEIYYYNIDDSIVTAGVYADIIPDYNILDDTDVVHVPEGQDMVLIEMVVNYLINKPDVELLNDNADRTNG